jgi:hypothetical protein
LRRKSWTARFRASRAAKTHSTSEQAAGGLTLPPLPGVTIGFRAPDLASRAALEGWREGHEGKGPEGRSSWDHRRSAGLTAGGKHTDFEPGICSRTSQATKRWEAHTAGPGLPANGHPKARESSVLDGGFGSECEGERQLASGAPRHGAQSFAAINSTNFPLCCVSCYYHRYYYCCCLLL